MTLAKMRQAAKKHATSDARLVHECLKGSEEAWSALIDKYKNLIFSIPINYGLSRDESADIFQGVCLELLAELRKLRNPKTLPKWLMQVTAHKCFHFKKHQHRLVSPESDEQFASGETSPRADQILRQAEEEQALRQAIAEIPVRCRQLIHMLFFEEPVREYREIAASLGLATGSIGFIRQRCLERLRRRLTELGF